MVFRVWGEMARARAAGAESALDGRAAAEARGRPNGLFSSTAGKRIEEGDRPPATPAIRSPPPWTQVGTFPVTKALPVKTGRPASLNAGRVPVTTFRPRPSQVVIYARPGDAATASSG